MKQQWQSISAKVAALSQRERIMILGAVLAMIWVLFDTLMIAPALKQQKLYRQEISVKQEEIGKMLIEQNALIQVGKNDPDALRKAQLGELQRKVAQMDAELRATQSELVPPDKMAKVLKSVLQQDRQVKLLSLTSLPASALFGDATGNHGKNTPAFGIYKHGFEIVVEGGYLDLMRYVTALESSPWRMLWGEVQLQAGEPPRSVLKLTLYTLSLDQAWLSI